MFHPTISTAFIINRLITNPNFFSEEYLFQIINIDNEVRIKITVQTSTITELEGVQSGRLIV